MINNRFNHLKWSSIRALQDIIQLCRHTAVLSGDLFPHCELVPLFNEASIKLLAARHRERKLDSAIDRRLTS